MAFSKDHYDNSVERDKRECKMTSGKLLQLLLQGSKQGGLAVGDAVNQEQSMSLRDTEKLAQKDVLMDGTCSEGRCRR